MSSPRGLRLKKIMVATTFPFAYVFLSFCISFSAVAAAAFQPVPAVIPSGQRTRCATTSSAASCGSCLCGLQTAFAKRCSVREASSPGSGSAYCSPAPADRVQEEHHQEHDPAIPFLLPAAGAHTSSGEADSVPADEVQLDPFQTRPNSDESSPCDCCGGADSAGEIEVVPVETNYGVRNANELYYAGEAESQSQSAEQGDASSSTNEPRIVTEATHEELQKSLSTLGYAPWERATNCTTPLGGLSSELRGSNNFGSASVEEPEGAQANTGTFSSFPAPSLQQQLCLPLLTNQGAAARIATPNNGASSAGVGVGGPLRGGQEVAQHHLPRNKKTSHKRTGTKDAQAFLSNNVAGPLVQLGNELLAKQVDTHAGAGPSSSSTAPDMMSQEELSPAAVVSTSLQQVVEQLPSPPPGGLPSAPPPAGRTTTTNPAPPGNKIGADDMIMNLTPRTEPISEPSSDVLFGEGNNNPFLSPAPSEGGGELGREMHMDVDLDDLEESPSADASATDMDSTATQASPSLAATTVGSGETNHAVELAPAVRITINRPTTPPVVLWQPQPQLARGTSKTGRAGGPQWTPPIEVPFLRLPTACDNTGLSSAAPSTPEIMSNAGTAGGTTTPSNEQVDVEHLHLQAAGRECTNSISLPPTPPLNAQQAPQLELDAPAGTPGEGAPPAVLQQRDLSRGATSTTSPSASADFLNTSGTTISIAPPAATAAQAHHHLAQSPSSPAVAVMRQQPVLSRPTSVVSSTPQAGSFVPRAPLVHQQQGGQTRIWIGQQQHQNYLASNSGTSTTPMNARQQQYVGAATYLSSQNHQLPPRFAPPYAQPQQMTSRFTQQRPMVRGTTNTRMAVAGTTFLPPSTTTPHHLAVAPLPPTRTTRPILQPTGVSTTASPAASLQPTAIQPPIPGGVGGAGDDPVPSPPIFTGENTGVENQGEFSSSGLEGRNMAATSGEDAMQVSQTTVQEGATGVDNFISSNTAEGEGADSIATAVERPVRREWLAPTGTSGGSTSDHYRHWFRDAGGSGLSFVKSRSSLFVTFDFDVMKISNYDHALQRILACIFVWR
ncbi:unnamed protein product [Amoebophrya sp. A120]|nr:unnamed protein product [Amoebophrya sp. A120]|eukprot:GSA120T00009888001.1